MSRLSFVDLVCRVLLGLSLGLLSGQSINPLQSLRQGITAKGAAAPVALGSTYVVNTTLDTPDADVGAPACADASGKCSLRAAIMQANFTTGADDITLPAGTYTLTRPDIGDEASAVLGDLDITDDLTIQGAGSGVTIVDGNGSVTHDRVFQVLSTAKNVTINGLSIRNGKRTGTFDEGGGLLWDGDSSHFILNDVVVENNASPYGGGLFLNYSAIGDVATLDHMLIHANTSSAAAGGLGANFGDFATFALAHSQVYGNTAYEGGGIYFQGTPPSGLLSVHVQNTDVYSNTASLSAGFENHSGAANAPVVLVNDNFYSNHASLYGAGIGNYGVLSIITSTLDSNTAVATNTDVTKGGGIYDYEGGVVNLQRSTISRNTAQLGGGIFSELFIHNTSALTLTDATLSGNAASQDGGGIYAEGGTWKLFNTTIASNQLVLPGGVTGSGGGVYVLTPAVPTNPHSVIYVENLLLANNTVRHSIGLPAQDDCFGDRTRWVTTWSKSTANCIISGVIVGIITGFDPVLGPLADYGGPTQTQALEKGSPAIDTGETPACTDANNAVIPVDQRGFPRQMGVRCDLGAEEYPPFDVYLSVLGK